MTIYKLGTQQQMYICVYINRLIPFIGIYYLGRQFAANAVFLFIYLFSINTQIVFLFYGLGAVCIAAVYSIATYTV